MKKQTWQKWARACGNDPSSPSVFGKYGKNVLAPLTGQDMRALGAIVECWELYACSDEAGQRGALAAVRALLPAMQESTRWMARELIPYVLEWSDRERVWPLVSDTPDVSAEAKRLADAWVRLHEFAPSASEVGDIAPDVADALNRLVVKLGLVTGAHCLELGERLEGTRAWPQCVLPAGHLEAHKDSVGREWPWGEVP